MPETARDSLTITSKKNSVVASCRHLAVKDPFLQRRNAALSIIVPAASNSLAITSQKNCVAAACRNLGVNNSFLQGWNAERPKSESNSLTITSQKHRVPISCRNLRVNNSFIRGWNVALSVIVPAASNSLAVISQQHRVTPSRRNLGVKDSLLKGSNARNGTFNFTATSSSFAITLKQDCMTAPCRHLAVWNAFIQRWNVTLAVIILATSNSLAVASEKNCVMHSCKSHSTRFSQSVFALRVTEVSSCSSSSQAVKGFILSKLIGNGDSFPQTSCYVYSIYYAQLSNGLSFSGLHLKSH